MICKAPGHTDRDPFGFTGGLDAGNGIWKLGARFYDSSKSAFIQQDRYMGDPSDPLSLNRYVYCGMDPVNYVDPTGFARTFLQETGDKLSKLSFSMNVLGIGLAASSLVAGPEMLVPSEAVGVCAAVVDTGATLAYVVDALTGNSSSWGKAAVSAVGIVGDILINSSVAVKPALNGINFYSKATGKYIKTTVSATAEAGKPAATSIGISVAGDILTNGNEMGSENEN